MNHYLRMTLLTAFLLPLSAGPTFAAVEENFDPSKPMVTTPWFSSVGIEEKQADLGFITGMRPHHAGALTMSQEYLASADASNPTLKQLARGIIRNQEFEISMLDNIENLLNRISPAEGQKLWAQVATKGLAQKARFTRSPMPAVHISGGEISAEDVRFSKAMIIHHQGALDMANEYLANPAAQNGYLRLMCQDILLDQSQEIALMQSVVDSYKGDAEAIKIDPSMVHGMDHHHH